VEPTSREEDDLKENQQIKRDSSQAVNKHKYSTSQPSTPKRHNQPESKSLSGLAHLQAAYLSVEGPKAPTVTGDNSR